MEGYYFKKENTKNPGQIIKVYSFSKSFVYFLDKNNYHHRINKNKILPCWFEEGDVLLHAEEKYSWQLDHDDAEVFNSENTYINVTDYIIPKINLKDISERIEKKITKGGGSKGKNYLIYKKENCYVEKPNPNEEMISRDGGLGVLKTDHLDQLSYQNGYEFLIPNKAIDFTEDILYSAINIAEKSSRFSGWVYANSDNCMEFFNENTKEHN